MGRNARSFRPRKDDGRTIVCAGRVDGPPCTCGRGHLQWAEAGYVPYHRICDGCGSHWELHPVMWGPMLPSDWYQGPDTEYTFLFDRDVHGQREVPLRHNMPFGGSGRTWGDVLAMITPAMWEAAKLEKERMAHQVVVPCCWARRARFYAANR